MRAAVLICMKDLKARIRDRSALLIGIVVPLSLAFIFNSIFSGISGNSKVISLGVVNVDRGVVAQQFVGQVLGAVGRSGLIAVHSEETVAGARALAAKGTLNAVIVIPAGFSARVQANQPASMQVIGNVDSPISSEIARSIAEGYTSDLNRVRLSVATVVHGGGGSSGPAPGGSRCSPRVPPRPQRRSPFVTSRRKVRNSTRSRSSPPGWPCSSCSSPCSSA